MTAGFWRSSLGAAALLAALSLCAGCTDSAAERGSGGTSAGAAPSPPSPASVFDGTPITVAVKRGQPGFSARGTRGYQGFDVALSRFLAHDLRFTEKLVAVPADQREQRLVSGRADLAVATYTITDARDERIDFTAPYFKTYQGLLVRRNDASIRTVGDVRGKRVCSASGTTSDPDAAPGEEDRRRLRNAFGAEVAMELREDYTACVRELREGRLDAVWMDRILLEGFARTPPYSGDVKVVPDIAVQARQFYGIGIKEGHEADCRRLNKALRAFLSTRWRETFRDHYPELAKRDPSFEQKYKPTNHEFDVYEAASCGARKG